jgi:cell wall-associated NlpC family hydrolase
MRRALLSLACAAVLLTGCAAVNQVHDQHRHHRAEQRAPRQAPDPTPSTSTTPPTPDSDYVTRIPPPPRCLPASESIVGVKVYLVQQALGIVGHRERYDATTLAAVRRFQADHGLGVDGIVGPLTWAELPIEEPYCVDQYVAQPAVGLDAASDQRIEAMIGYAEARLGLPYVWGGAGPMGFDCSGLALQAVYAGGRDVRGLDTNMHVGAEFRTTHYLYESELPHVPMAERRRGDLVFFGSPITHMAIYLGHDRILEAVRPVIRVADLHADGLPIQPLVVRPFPG